MSTGFVRVLRKCFRKIDFRGKYSTSCRLLSTVVVRSLRLLIRLLVLGHVFVVDVSDGRGSRWPGVHQILRILSSCRRDNRANSRNLRLVVAKAHLVSVSDGRLVRQKHCRGAEHVAEWVVLKIQEGCGIKIGISDNLEGKFKFNILY